jgi:hypothetical protein
MTRQTDGLARRNFWLLASNFSLDPALISTSFPSQRDERVDACGAQGGDEGGEDADGTE